MSLGEIYSTFIYEPLYNLLVLLYDFSGGDIIIAIILLTAIVKGVLWPLSAKALESQKKLQDLQPKLEALKKEYSEKDQKEELGKAMMDLYSKEKVNPASSCLPTLVQLPIFIAIYQSMRHGLKSDGFDKLYSWVPNPGSIDATAFGGAVDLAKPIIVLAIVAAIAQFFQAKMMMSKPPPKVKGAEDEAMATIINKQMVYMMPAITVIIGIKLPGGLMVYWLMMTLLTILQQWWTVNRKAGKPDDKAGDGDSDKGDSGPKRSKLLDKMKKMADDIQEAKRKAKESGNL